jgi:hypothetical protein
MILTQPVGKWDAYASVGKWDAYAYIRHSGVANFLLTAPAAALLASIASIGLSALYGWSRHLFIAGLGLWVRCVV